jgi:hypothetical protein
MRGQSLNAEALLANDDPKLVRPEKMWSHTNNTGETA